MSQFMHNLQSVVTGRKSQPGTQQQGQGLQGPDLVNALVQSLNNNDFNTLLGYFSDGQLSVYMGGAPRAGLPFGSWNDKSSFGQALDQQMRNLSSHSVTIQDVWTVNPNRLAALVSSSGTVQATGMSWNQIPEAWFIDTDASGKIVQLRAFTDTLAVSNAYGGAGSGSAQIPTTLNQPGIAGASGQQGGQYSQGGQYPQGSSTSQYPQDAQSGMMGSSSGIGQQSQAGAQSQFGGMAGQQAQGQQPFSSY